MSEEFTTEQIRQVLDLELGENDSGQPTVRRYLLALLEAVWHDGESFDGKRPFGNSSWECDLYLPLIKAGLVKGGLDSDGYLERCDERTANALIHAAIKSLDAPAAPAGDQAATVIVVTEVGYAGKNRERPIDGDSFSNGLLGLTIKRGDKTIAFYPTGSFLNVREDLAQPPRAASITGLYRDVLQRLADEDTPVLGEGLGGGAQEELHVRASLAAHTLGRDTCGCTECMVSLELDRDQDGRHPDGCKCQFCQEDERDAQAHDVDVDVDQDDDE